MKLSVLIDADNASPFVCTELFTEISKYGVANVKRAYGDWTVDNLKGWKAVLHKHAIQPIQQFSYTTGKNSTDSSLIIDAMDLLHGGKLDGFCIVSSDSDFTRLATRIRESGLVVYGFGEKKTPDAFISSCDQFIYTEVLKPIAKNVAESIQEPGLKSSIISAINAVSNDDEWATLAHVGAHITKNDPSFDPRNYGRNKLSDLVRSLNYIQTQDRKDGHGRKHIYIKEK
ncbi:NYN domain-containing protein [Pectobacterium parmentieri]|uniref:NYN domain-containing protein n=1 Tax=Pectobacterium parmentieri TaxID=1905730 RepID=UPI0018E1107A|nr:NYN domain-containing protein [Pectobacterium parmentieri]QQA78282.1 NYN domain-containing protein [Pectobacterium parmentieri]